MTTQTFSGNLQPVKQPAKIYTQYWPGFNKQQELAPTTITPSPEAQEVQATWLSQLKQGQQESPLRTELNKQAQSDLALGGSLSDEEARQADQTARGAYSARGLVAGRPAAAAEVLNRDAASRARQDSRRAFASGVEDQNLKAGVAQAQTSSSLGNGILGYWQDIQDRETDQDRFNINRYDSRYMFDLKAAMDRDQAAANKKAAKNGATMSAIGSIAGAAALAFL